MSVFQIVAKTVEFTVSLDGTFRSFEISRTVAVNDSPSSVDQGQTRMDHIARKIVPYQFARPNRVLRHLSFRRLSESVNS